MTIELTTTKQVIKDGTKSVWVTESVNTEDVTLKQHGFATDEATVKGFRRMGGSETVTKSYTSQGYVVTKLVSTSPNKSMRTIREYNFDKKEG
jgi:hypothetical protein